MMPHHAIRLLEMQAALVAYRARRTPSTRRSVRDAIADYREERRRMQRNRIVAKMECVMQIHDAVMQILREEV